MKGLFSRSKSSKGRGESSEGTSSNPRGSFQGPMTARRASLLEPTHSSRQPDGPPASRPPSAPRSSGQPDASRSSRQPSAPRSSGQQDAPRSSRQPSVPRSSRQPSGPHSSRQLWPPTQAEVSAPRMPEIRRAPAPGPSASEGGSSGVQMPPPLLFLPRFIPAIPAVDDSGAPIYPLPPQVTPSAVYLFVPFATELISARVSSSAAESESVASAPTPSGNDYISNLLCYNVIIKLIY